MHPDAVLSKLTGRRLAMKDPVSVGLCSLHKTRNLGSCEHYSNAGPFEIFSC